MPDLGNERTQKLDDELARYADQLLAGETPDTQESVGVDTELLELEKVVMRLNQTVGTGQPDRVMADRIRANLASEWRTVHSKDQEASIWRQLWRRTSPAGKGSRTATVPVRTIGLALAVVVLIAVALVVPLDLPGGLTGSAGQPGEGSINPVLIVGGLVVLGGVVWWLLRSKR